MTNFCACLASSIHVPGKPWRGISGFIVDVLHASLTANVKWLIQVSSSFSPATPPPPSNGEIRLQMENKELPSEEKAIMVWPDVQPNAKNSISHWKDKEQKQNKRPPIPYPFVMAWLLPSGSGPPACQRHHFLFECCERGAWSRVNGNNNKNKKTKKGKGLSRAALTCLKHESSSTVFPHPIFPRLFPFKSLSQMQKPQCLEDLENTWLGCWGATNTQT